MIRLPAIALAAFVFSTNAAAQQYLGNYSANPYNPDSSSNSYGAGSLYNPNSINNPYGTYGSPYSASRRRILMPLTHPACTTTQATIAGT
jgi:hypothetical protein